MAPRRPLRAPLTDELPIPGMSGRSRRKTFPDDEACECSVCGSLFPTVKAFDEHRKDER